jgi:YtcA-like protein
MNGLKALPLTALIFLTGCRGAPSINLVGSFFPAWMLCVAIGVFGVLILRRVFVRTEIEAHLGTLPLVYFCLWVLLTLGSWLLFFRG